MRTRNVYVKTVHFDMPPKWLYESYEEKRDIEIRKKQREVQKMLHSLTDSREKEKKDRRSVSQNSLKNLKQFRAEKPTETSPKQSPNQNQ